MTTVFVTRAIPGQALSQLAAAGHAIDLWPGELPPPPDALAAHLRAADAALTMVSDRIPPELLPACPKLRVVANMAVGYDNVDPAAAAAAGVWVTNTPGVLADTTADFAFALLLATARQVVASERDTRAGGWKAWSPTAFLGADVYGSTLGVVGMGQIGAAFARRAQGFAMRILYTSRTPKPAVEAETGARWVSLPELLAASDFVSIHTPLTASTRGLISTAELALMRPSAILVNTSRGAVVDQEALVAALRAGTIAGAALDVTEPEPLPLGHPLFMLPNVVVTPHIASAGRATRARMAEIAAANILAVLARKDPPNPVNRPVPPR
ncbi:MAG: D-glycerate dehydrogenase [Dehalococcoidia bacterium]|nr:D-glycerate dehydrogenase [Dehalococcoidia bacterium]